MQHLTLTIFLWMERRAISWDWQFRSRKKTLMQLEGETNNIASSVSFNFRNGIVALDICCATTRVRDDRMFELLMERLSYKSSLESRGDLKIKPYVLSQEYSLAFEPNFIRHHLLSCSK